MYAALLGLGLPTAVILAIRLVRRGSPGIYALKRTIVHAFERLSMDPKWEQDRACVILSGGLDSCIAAEAGAEHLGLRTAVTVVASECGTDLRWSRACAQKCGFSHHIIRPSLEQLLHMELPTVIEVLKSFDPMSLRNEIAISCALRAAADLGMLCAVTGDGADELFGGYSFTHGLPPEKWKHNQQSMARIMEFGSVPLGAHFGLHVASPFTQPPVVKMALRFDKADCVWEASQGQGVATPPGVATRQSGATVGKMPLRRAFPDVTSVARGKDPIEVGCGTTELSKPHYFDALISDSSFQTGAAAAKADHGVAIRDKEHLYYFRTFMEVFPGGEVPGKPRDSPLACPACRYPLSHPSQTFCVTCGHYDPALPARLGHSKQRPPQPTHKQSALKT